MQEFIHGYIGGEYHHGHSMRHWIDSSTNPGYYKTRYRLRHFRRERYANGNLKKRGQRIEPGELPGIRVQVDRGSKLKAARTELEQVMAAIATIERTIRAPIGG